MKSPTLSAQVFSKFNPPICTVNVLNNIKVRVNMRETEHDTTFETS